MRAPKAQAEILGYFAMKQHVTSSFSNSGVGGGERRQLPQVDPLPGTHDPTWLTSNFLFLHLNIFFSKFSVATTKHRTRTSRRCSCWVLVCTAVTHRRPSRRQGRDRSDVGPCSRCASPAEDWGANQTRTTVNGKTLFDVSFSSCRCVGL